eukprot:492740_1
MNILKMTTEDYSFQPVGTAEPSAPTVEAVPANQSSETYQDDEVESPSDTAILVGCGLLGWVVAGPFLAIITALGGKYAADRNQGPIGDTSRAIGRIASAAGKKAKEERLFCKLKAAVRRLFCKLKAAVRSIFTKEDCQCNSYNTEGCTSA